MRFQSNLHESGRLFSECLTLYKLKRGDLISGGNQFCRRSDLFGPPLWYYNFKSFLNPNSSSFIRFQCILYDSRVLLSGFSNLYKLKREDLISAVNQFFRMSELFGPPFYISILKVFQTQIFRHLLAFNAICMIQEYSSQGFQISTNSRVGT